MRPATLLLSALLFATTTAPVEAQLLQGRWFKLTVTAAGTGFNPETSEAETGKLKKTVRYAQFGIEAVEGVAPTYTIAVYSPTTEGGWVNVSGGNVQMLDTAETYVRSASIELPTQPVAAMEGDPNFAGISFNGPCKLKDEELKSAKITSFGATCFFSNPDVVFFYGKAKVTLAMVDVTDLPFELSKLAATKPQPEPTKVEPTVEAKVDAKSEEPREEQPAKP